MASVLSSQCFDTVGLEVHCAFKNLANLSLKVLFSGPQLKKRKAGLTETKLVAVDPVVCNWQGCFRLEGQM